MQYQVDDAAARVVAGEGLALDGSVMLDHAKIDKPTRATARPGDRAAVT